MKPSTPPLHRRCVATRANGQRCRAWTPRPTPGSPAPATCSAHSSRPLSGPAQPAPPASGPVEPLVLDALRAGGYYDDLIADREFAVLEAVEHDLSAQSELRLVRVILRRLFADFAPQHGLSGRKMESRALTLFKGAALVAQLLLVQRELQGGEDDPARNTLRLAFDELAQELGLDEPFPTP